MTARLKVTSVREYVRGSPSSMLLTSLFHPGVIMERIFDGVTDEDQRKELADAILR